MHRIWILALSLWPAVTCSQGAPPDAFSATLRDHLKGERFAIVTSIRGLPLGVRDELQTLFNSATLDIAEPDSAFDPTQPGRRLISAGCANDHHCLVYYERGGDSHTRHVALFHWTPEATRFEGGGAAPGGLATIGEVRDAILSGAVKGPASSW